MSGELEGLLREIRACRICERHLPLGPNPVLRVSADARLLMVSQAPGIRVHATGIPWNDASGRRRRDWLQMDATTFYDERRVAIVPMGLCYPGKAGSGDAPPRPECRATWHARLLSLLPKVQLTLLVGQYAQVYVLGARRKPSLGETVRAWRDYLPAHLRLPHPSPSNVGWFKANPWFEAEVLAVLRERVHALLAAPCARA
jgi:uracil-DNA glycosylase